jgi:hypothetical protein
LSSLLNQVVRRSGWRAGNAVLVSITQDTHTNLALIPCRILSYEAGQKFAPLLRVRFTAPEAFTASTSANMPCNVTLTVDAFESRTACYGGSIAIRGRAYATSEQAPAPGDRVIVKDAYQKLDNTLTFEKALDLCARHSARLCTIGEIFDLR